MIKDIDVNINSQGEYVEFVEKETAEEVKMEEPFHVNTNAGVGSHTEMDVNVSEVNDEGIEEKVKVKDVTVEGIEENITAGSSARSESGEYIEEDDTEFKPKIESVEEDCETYSESNPEIPEEESDEERESGDDSDSDSMTPERYERQAKLDALYKEQLGLTIEDDDDEEEREVGFYLYIYFIPSISWIFQVEAIHDMIINTDCVPEEKLFLIKYVRHLSINHLILWLYSSEGVVEYHERVEGRRRMPEALSQGLDKDGWQVHGHMEQEPERLLGM